MANKIIDILTTGWLVLILIAFLSLGVVVLLTEQDKSVYTDESCSQIKECVLMDMFCLDRTVNNKFFFLEWRFDDKALLYEQRDYYKLNCHDVLLGEEEC